MSIFIRKFLVQHIRKQRFIALLAAIGWMAALILAGLMPHQRMQPHSWHLIVGAAVCLVIIAKPIVQLFRRFDFVAAAMEIESHQPDLDQRLITVASQPPGSPLLDQLMIDVENELTRAPRQKTVSLRPLLAPALAMIAAGLLLWFNRSGR